MTHKLYGHLIYDKCGTAKPLRNWYFHKHNKNFAPYFTPHTKFNCRWTVNLNVKGKTNLTKFLEDNIGEISSLSLSRNNFLNRSQEKHSPWRKKTDEMNYIKIRNLCSIKHTLKRGEKANHWIGDICNTYNHQKTYLYSIYSQN